MEGAMATFARRARFEPSAEPNVIPFIDVLLVLLIIFMVTAPKPTTDLRVDLPRSHAGPPPVIEPTIVSVRATADGYRILVGDEEAALDRLGARTLAHVLAADSTLSADTARAEARIFVRADLDVAYQHIVGVVDELQHARFEKVAIVAQRADET
jgi:biopolymer transport protein ExbD